MKLYEQCKECIGAMHGMEQTSASECLPLCENVAILLLLLFSLPCVWYNRFFKPQHKINTNYAFQSQSFPSSLLSCFVLFFIFPLFYIWSHTLKQCLLTLSHYPHDICIFSHSPSFIFSFICLYTLFSLYHQYLQVRLYDMRSYSMHIFKSVLLLIKKGINSNQILFSFLFLTLCALSFLSHLQWEDGREWDLFTVVLVCQQLLVNWVKKVRAMVELNVWLMGTSA